MHYLSQNASYYPPGKEPGANEQSDAEAKVYADYQKTLNDEAQARSDRREERRRNRLPHDVGPTFTEPLPKAARESHGTEGDALVRVGNFLGSSQSTLSRIGERTNQLLYSIDQRLSTMKATGGIQFPST